MQISNKKITILDCTIRDGGYLNNWDFDKRFVREIYRALSKSGVDYVELGYYGSEKYFNKTAYGPWRFLNEEILQEATTGISGAKIAAMVDFGKIDLSDIKYKKNSLMDLIRVAVHKPDLADAVIFAENIKAKGYEVSINLMGYSNYSGQECKEAIAQLKNASIDYVYIADTYGSILPDQINRMFAGLLALDRFKIGFHPHNNLQMAFANAIEALRCGVTLIDGSIYGMGRAAGNLPIEVILAYGETQYLDKYNSIPVLNIIDKYFIELQQDAKWGYQLPYMLSGMFKCHPDYAKKLIEMQEYAIEDIRHILEIIKEKNTIGFSYDALKDVLKKGIFGNKLNAVSSSSAASVGGRKSKESPVSYIGRHKGADFLILANGPSLKEYKTQINTFIRKYKPIILGANYLENLFVPHYHAFNNKKRFTAYIDLVDVNSRLLIGQYIPQAMIKDYIKRDYETLCYLDISNNEFGIDNGVIQTNCRTISVLLAGVAIAMGAKRIFIAGMDGYTDLVSDSHKGFHFYTEKEEANDLEVIRQKHTMNLSFLRQIDRYLIANGKEGIHILTPTAYKRFYKGINNYIEYE